LTLARTAAVLLHSEDILSIARAILHAEMGNSPGATADQTFVERLGCCLQAMSSPLVKLQVICWELCHNAKCTAHDAILLHA
jgi:hypothetical protein